MLLFRPCRGQVTIVIAMELIKNVFSQNEQNWCFKEHPIFSGPNDSIMLQFADVKGLYWTMARNHSNVRFLAMIQWKQS